MRKDKYDATEHVEEWDAGTYQTGSITPPKRSRGIVAFLLVMVIFLGGMASALGIINFRLLTLMADGGDSVTPLATHTIQPTTDPNAFLESYDAPVPTVPQDRHMKLVLDQAGDAISVTDIYRKNQQSLVSVYCTTYCNETLSGTGIILSADGYILTNAHVIESAKRIFVYLPDGRLMRAATVGSDPFTDLALLYIDSDGLTPAVFASTQPLQADEAVYALENQPDADENTILDGKVRSLKNLSTGDLHVQVLQTSINGTSGPIFNSKGQIVAIQAGNISQYFAAGSCGSLGIAVPSDVVQTVIESLAKNGYVDERPQLGIRVEAISKLYQHYWDLPGGLLVTDLEEGSDAVKQGLQSGDILLTLGNVTLNSRTDLYTILYSSNIGDQVTAAVFRDGISFTITLTIGEMDE